MSVENESSCLTQIQWDWSNSADSKRWTREFQTYRVRKPYYPRDPSDTTESTFNVIETRNKIRGTGKVISVLMKSEPGKHLTIYGWSINIGVNQNV